MATSGLVCNLPSSFDKQFVEKFMKPLKSGATKEEVVAYERYKRGQMQKIADIRANIEMSTGKQINEFNFENISLIRTAQRQQREAVVSAVRAKGNTKLRSLVAIKLNTRASDRDEIVQSIANQFSHVVDRIMFELSSKENPVIPDRSDITLGVTLEDGTTRYGEAAILDTVLDDFYTSYRQLLETLDSIPVTGLVNQAQRAKLLDAQRMYELTFKNWANFISLARKEIMIRENLVSNDNFTYSEEASFENFSDNIEQYDPEVNTRESWQQANEERDPFASIGTRVRRMLASLPVYTVAFRNGEYVAEPVLTKLGTQKFMSASDAHKLLVERLRGMQSSSDMINILSNSGEPWVQPILNEIQRDPYFATQLYVDLKRNFQYYSNIAKLGKKGNKSDVSILNEEKVDIYLNKLLCNLTFNPSSIESSSTVFDKKGNVRKKDVDRVVGRIIDNLAGDNIRTFNNKHYQTRANIIQDILSNLGIEADYIAIEYMVKAGKTRVLYQSLVDLVNYGLKGLKDGSSFESYFGADEEGNKKPIEENYGKIIKTLNQFNPVVNKLYKIRSKNAKGVFADRYSDVNPSYLGSLVETLNRFSEEDDKEGLKNFLINEFFRDSTYARKVGSSYIIYNAVLRDLWEQANNSKPLNINFKVVESLSSDDVVSENLSAKQHSISQIKYYFTKYAGIGKAFYPVFILGDSNKLKYITGKKYSKNEDIYKEFYKLFLREIKRAQAVELLNEQAIKQGYKKLPWIDRNEKFSILQTMQPILGDKKVSEFFLSEEEFIEKFKGLIEGEEGEANKSLNFFKQLGVFDEKDGKYINLQGTEFKPDNIEDKWINYFLNNKLAMALQLNILDIDTVYAEGSKDLQKRNKQNHAPGTVVDTDATYDDGTQVFPDKMETIAYFDDIAINTEDTNPEFMRVIAKKFGEKSDVYSAYTINKKGKNAVTLTDGQGYRTLDSYRKIMRGRGLWTKAMERVYQDIKSLNNPNLTKEEREKTLRRIDKSSVIFQPLKPFTYTHEKIECGIDENEEPLVVTIPVQIKYAEAILIPELLPEGTLKTMAEWMQENNVDVMASTKCVKMGMWASTGLPTIKTDDTKAASEELKNALNSAYLNPDGSFKLGVHKLDYRDYRVQTNVPPHTDVSRTIGTQIRKLIMSDLRFNIPNAYDSYFLNSEGKTDAPILFEGESDEVRNNVDGKRLVNIYNSLIISNILTAFDKFEKEIKDNKKLSKLLQNTALNTDRVSMDSLLAYGLTGNEEFLIPLFENSLEHDTISEILSIFRKKVNKQQMRGGSAVQVSAMGIKGFREDKSLKVVTEGEDNCLYAECEMPFDLSYTDEFGMTHNLEYDDYCNEDGTLKMTEDGKITLIESRFPGILDVIAYRVPTERNYSTLNLKIVRFSRKVEGGTIKVPAQYTVVAGFDFDIDKLYLLRKDFVVRSRKEIVDEKEERERKELLNQIWADIYAGKYQGGQNVFTRLSEEQASAYEDSLKAKHIRFNRDSETYKKGLKKFAAKHPLYNYWDAAGLPGTRQEAFLAYMEENQDLWEDVTKEIEYSQRIEDITWDTYDTQIVPEKQSSVARNNMLHHIMRQRLMDPETLESRYRPGGFPNASYAARIMRELTLNDDVDSYNQAITNTQTEQKDPEPSYDTTNPETMIIYNQMNQVAGKLIGVFANQNVNHALASLAQSITLRTPIKFDGHLDGYSDLLHNPDGKDTFRTVAEFLAASVDAVKDPVLNYLNFNNLTANAAGLLGRLGYEPVEIGLLFNQPLIKEVCENAQNNGTSLATAIASVKKNYRKEYGEAVDKTFNDGDINLASSENLADYIIKGRKGVTVKGNQDFGKVQFKLLNLFTSITEAADELNDFIKATKFTAANSVGSTMGDIYEQRQNVESYLERARATTTTKNGEEVKSSYLDIVLSDDISTASDTPIDLSVGFFRTKKGINISDYIRKVMNNPFSYEQCMFDCTQALPHVLQEDYPYETHLYEKIRSITRGATVSNKRKLKAATVNNIHREIVQFVLSSRGYWNASRQMITTNMLYKKDKPMTIGQYYKYQFGLDYLHFSEENDFAHLYPNLSKMIVPTVQNVMTTIEGMGKTEVPMVSLNTASGRGHEIFRQDTIDMIKEEIEEMAKKFPAAAFGLYFYNYYKMGFLFGGNSLQKIFPSSLIYSLPVGQDVTGKQYYYTDLLKDILNGDIDADANEFLKQFILNHLDDNTFVYTLNNEATEEFEALKKVSRSVKNGFVISAADCKDLEVFKPIIRKESRQGEKTVKYTWAPIIAVKEKGNIVYYMANVSGAASNDLTFYQSNDNMTYTKVEPLGEAGKYSSYGKNIESAKVERELSSFDEAANIDESEMQIRDVDFERKPEYDMYKDMAVTEPTSAIEIENQRLFEEHMASREEVFDDNGNPIC